MSRILKTRLVASPCASMPPLSIGLVPLTLFLSSASAQVCTFSWKTATGGLFSDAGRWSVSPQAPAECQGRAPHSGENVSFLQGAYTVSVPGGLSMLVTEFGLAGSPPYAPWDIAFALGGAYSTQVLATSDRFTVSGTGSLAVTDYYNLGPNGTVVIDQATMTVGPFFTSLPEPADPYGRIVVKNGGQFHTLAGGVPATRVEGATWQHDGPPGGMAHITVIQGGQFSAPALQLTSQRLRAESGGAISVPELASDGPVEILSGATMMNQTATLGYGDKKVDGAGSNWTIAGALSVPSAAAIVSSNGAELVLGSVTFTDPASFASLSAKGTNGRVRVQKRLELLKGNAYANDGGIFTVPEVSVGGGRQVVVQKGTGGLSGAEFDCAGTMEIGSVAASSPGSVSIGGGGRCDARKIVIGYTQNQSGLTVDAGNGSTARLFVTEAIQIGQGGQGTMRVNNGAQVEFAADGGYVAVTPVPTGAEVATPRGELTVSGSGSLLDLKRGALGVGIQTTGLLTVSAGGQIKADSLDVGANADDAIVAGTGSTALITGAQSRVNLVSGFRVWEGTVRVINGGFLQVTSEPLNAEFTLISPAVVELTNGSAEVGTLGPPPAGILRVSRGRLNGSGTVKGSVEVISQGTCRVGSMESNILRVDGSYLQDANGRLVTEISGPAANETDILDVGKGVTLNGTLTVYFSGGFAPAAGSQFGIVRFGEGLTGSFANVEIEGLAPGVTFVQKVLSPGVYGLEFSTAGTSAGCPPSAPTILSFTGAVPGEFAFDVHDLDCGIHAIEWSDDLKTWRFWTEFTVDAAGHAHVVDRRRGFIPHAYYRAVRR